MFSVKKLEIDAGNNFIAELNKYDAKELGLYAKDKIEIISNKSRVICDLEISQKNQIKRGEIGIYENVYQNLNPQKRVKIIPAPKPKSVEIIRKKFEFQRRIKAEEFDIIIKEILDNKLNDITKTFFVLACSGKNLNDDEVIGLTNAMVNVGEILDFKKSKNDIIVDKHCIGGVPNNRTTMIAIPIIASAGLKIPKTSSRSITSPAGTADTMEVLANVDITISKMHSIVEETNGCLVWGGGVSLSPADDVIIEIEHPLEIDSQGQMIASILSKKKCAGSTHVLIDIPVGTKAKITSTKEAKLLKKRFEKIGRAIGLKVLVKITNGSQPVGSGIGPELEARDVIEILENKDSAPQDLKEKALEMAGDIFEIANISQKNQGYNKAKEILLSGKALDKFEQIRHLQGRKEFFKEPEFKEKIKAEKQGKIKTIDNKLISKLSFALGAPQDKQAGIKLYKKIGDKINKGDVLFEIQTTTNLKLKYAKTFIEESGNPIQLE